jgi:hypothetical protein
MFDLIALSPVDASVRHLEADGVWTGRSAWSRQELAIALDGGQVCGIQQPF